MTARPGLWSNRHGLGAAASQTRAPERGIVAAEGGGLLPTLFSGGGADGFWLLALPTRTPVAAAANLYGGLS